MFLKAKTALKRYHSIQHFGQGGEDMKLKELSRRVYLGENLLTDVLNVLFDSAEVRERILSAVKSDIPMMIYDDCYGGDGLLYRALKNVGCKTVRSYQIDKENGNMQNNTAYFTIFLNKTISEEY